MELWSEGLALTILRATELGVALKVLGQQSTILPWQQGIRGAGDSAWTVNIISRKTHTKTLISLAMKTKKVIISSFSQVCLQVGEKRDICTIYIREEKEFVYLRTFY